LRAVAATRIESDALVVRAVTVGESDVIATLITERVGKVSAMVRGARRSTKRVGGALEPMHTIAVHLDDFGGEMATMREARVVKFRPALVGNLEGLEAAGTALRWARQLFPPRTPEPEGWRILITLLDALEGGAPPGRALAGAGMTMLAAVGYGMELDQCVGCGRECPESRSACIDPARGGLVCRACGGASTVVAPSVRRAARALGAGPGEDVGAADASAVLELVVRAMAAHGGVER